MFRAAYLRNNELMNRGDVETALDWIPAAFEWHVLADAVPGQDRLEAPPVLGGHEQAIGFFREMAKEWDWRPEPPEFVDPRRRNDPGARKRSPAGAGNGARRPGPVHTGLAFR
jgi:hypothetical protein